MYCTLLIIDPIKFRTQLDAGKVTEDQARVINKLNNQRMKHDSGDSVIQYIKSKLPDCTKKMPYSVMDLTRVDLPNMQLYGMVAVFWYDY